MSVLVPMPTTADIQALATAQNIPVDSAKVLAFRNWKVTNLTAIRAEIATSPAAAIDDFIAFLLLIT